MHHTVIQGMKVDLFWESQVQKSWVNQGAPYTSITRPNRFGKKTMVCVWWNHRGVVYCELFKPWETINTKRYQQHLTDSNRSLFEKSPERGNIKLFFFVLRSITCVKTALCHLGSTQIGSSTPCGLLARLGSFRLPLDSIDDFTHLLTSALVRTKMWKNSSMNGSQQRGKIFTGVVFTNCRKMEKCVITSDGTQF